MSMLFIDKVRMRELMGDDFTLESFLHLVSMAIMALCGLLFFILVARYYNAYTLGVFNLVYSVYIVVAQISCLGIQASTLYYVARHRDTKEVFDNVISTAVMTVGILATASASIVVVARHFIGLFFGNRDIAVAIAYSVIGLWCFILNKLFLNIINGLNRMKVYPLFLSLRYLFLILALVIALTVRLPARKLPFILTVSEGALLISMVIYCSRIFSFVPFRNVGRWVKVHCAFGIRGLPGLMLADINTRLDVLMLGYFYSETIVGLYSFVAIIIEGINQFAFALKRNIAPVFTKLATEGKIGDVERIVRRGSTLLFPIMTIVGLVGILFYPFIAAKIVGKLDFVAAWPLFSLLIIGSVVQDSYAPFSGIFIQMGLPGVQTIYVLCIAMTNIILNILLIPSYAMLGAALATSVTFLMSVVYLKIFSKYKFHINI